MSSILRVENLTKSYKGQRSPALNNLSISIEKSQIFGLLGPNGAGKTTVVSILTGLLKYKYGSIKIDANELKNNRKHLKKKIGLVPQDIALYPTLSARENLTYFGRIYGLQGKNLHLEIDRYLRHFGLGAAADNPVNTFSGGMKRRTNLIAGILHTPKLLFLDEPTVGIDVQSKTVILEYLKELNSNGTTIVYTSHDLSEAEQLCDYIAIIDHGKKIAEGVPGQLLSQNSGITDLEGLFLKLTGRALRD